MRIVKLSLSTLSLALLIASFFSSLSFAASADRIVGGLTSGQTVALKGNVRHQALPQYDKGPVDPAMKLGTMTLLTLPTAAQQKAMALATEIAEITQKTGQEAFEILRKRAEDTATEVVGFQKKKAA